MKKPRLLVLTSSYPKWKGDVNGNFVYELTSRLKQTFEVFVLAPAYIGSLPRESAEGITIYRHAQFFLPGIELAYGSGILAKMEKNKAYLAVIPFYLLMQFITLVRVIKKEQINLIHAHWIIPQGIIAVLYKKLFNPGIKILGTVHGTDMNSFQNWFGRAVKKMVLRNIDELTVVSSFLKEEAEKIGYPKTIYVYPMGVDTRLFSPERRSQSLKTRLGIRGNFVLFVGSVIEQKGIRFLIEAMPRVLRLLPETKLVVIGDGNINPEMARLAAGLGVEDAVAFLGNIPHQDLPEYYATADIFVLPSLAEGLGLVVLEALSCKTLSIVSPIPAIRDVVIEQKTGLFFDAINPEQISLKIIHALQKREQCRHLAEQGREYVVARFDWDIVKNNYMRLILGMHTEE